MQLKNGDIFAEHYQLKKLLGVGSFGEVWLARNILADVDVAIKLYGLLDDNGIKDFREEFKLAYKLHHPNLLHLNHFDVFGQCPFLVMPYCPKGSSASLKGKMSEKQIWRFIRDVSCGLMFLHNQNPPIIHQDIKPDNILIGDDDKFIISDFGISRKLEHINPAKRKAMAVKNEKRFLKQKRNALKNPGYSRHPVKTQASFKRLLKAV